MNLQEIKNTLLLINIDSLPTDEMQLGFIKLLSQVNEAIERQEIANGVIAEEQIKRIGKRFGRKTRYAVGVI
jgi:Mor family transcriptional regulator